MFLRIFSRYRFTVGEIELRELLRIIEVGNNINDAYVLCSLTRKKENS